MEYHSRTGQPSTNVFERPPARRPGALPAAARASPALRFQPRLPGSRHLRLFVRRRRGQPDRSVESRDEIGVAPESIERFKLRVREMWRSCQSRTSQEPRGAWKSFVQSWWGTTATPRVGSLSSGWRDGFAGTFGNSSVQPSPTRSYAVTVFSCRQILRDSRYDPAGFNRGIRKTVRTAVWEGRRAQSRSLDPIFHGLKAMPPGCENQKKALPFGRAFGSTRDASYARGV